MTGQRAERDGFVAAAFEFCELFESARELGAERLLAGLARALPRLHAAAASLPYPDDAEEIPDDDLDVGPSPEEMRAIARPAAEVLREVDWSSVQDQLHESTVGGRLRRPARRPIRLFLDDDLWDVYRDVKEGFRLLEAGRPEAEAVFLWRDSFWSHWGRHNAEALRVVHYYVALHLGG